MEKLLFLPLMLLMLNCGNSKDAKQATENQDDMEQVISIGGSTQPVTEAEEQAQEQNISIEQGIAGKVLWVSGNQMPSPDAPRSGGSRGIARTVYIYELTKGGQATTTDGVFHSNIQTKLVKQVETDTNGYFEVKLEPGKYSLFTKEDKGMYANLFDGDNNIFPVEVKRGEVTKVEFLINYAATY